MTITITGTTLWIIGAAAIVVAVALALMAARRFRPVVTIASPEEAVQAAEQAITGFAAQGAVVGADGAGALAVDRGGRVAVIQRAGTRIAVREVAWSALRSTAGGIVIDGGERRFAPVLVAGVDALDIRRLAPQVSRA